MSTIGGVTGLRPADGRWSEVVTPSLEDLAMDRNSERKGASRPQSLVQVALGRDPSPRLSELIAEGALVTDGEAAFYLLEQATEAGVFRGVFATAPLHPASRWDLSGAQPTGADEDLIVQRARVAKSTGFTLGSVGLRSSADVDSVFARLIADASEPFATWSAITAAGVIIPACRLWRVPCASAAGQRLADVLQMATHSVETGAHSYQAAVRSGQTHVLAFIASASTAADMPSVPTGVILYKHRLA